MVKSNYRSHATATRTRTRRKAWRCPIATVLSPPEDGCRILELGREGEKGRREEGGKLAEPSIHKEEKRKGQKKKKDGRRAEANETLLNM